MFSAAKRKKPSKAEREDQQRTAASAKGAKRTAAGWESERQRSAATQAKKSQTGRDIVAGFPDVVDVARRDAACASFELFCRTYFPQTFNLPWSDDHLKAIALIERVAQTGGLFAYAMPRGSGKTSLAIAAVLWAVLCGHRQFIVVIGSDESKASGILESLKSELENNDLLLADFPAVCYPIRRLEGIAHRANGQLCNGQRTHITWTSDQLVLPTIADSPASGAIIVVTGITGGVRGLNHKRPDGRSVRPDLVLLDDPQTDQSARSPSQCQERLNVVNGAVLGLGGPGKKIAAIMPCTVIRTGDMADEQLDRQRHPQWQGERTKLVYQWPDALESLWAQYQKIRDDSLRAGNEGREATEFYAANRAAMDAGAKVAWPARHNPDELSALQHAINLRADLGDRAFFAEYQNDPLKEEAEASEHLTAEQIAAKANGRKRGVVPATATKLVAFIDVQKAALPWLVCAFEDDFTGYVVDYGFFPDQGRDYFALADVRRTLASVLKTKSLEASIRGGLDALGAKLLGREWPKEDGTLVRVDRCLVDANWGDSTDVVYKWCRESPHAAMLLPTHGKYIGAASRPFNDYKPKPGEQSGDHWLIPIPQNKRMIRYGRYDTNFYKTFLQERLATPAGGPGCLSLFGEDPQEHKLLADHLVAEHGVKVTAKDRTVTEWKIRPHRPDNHWLDCLVGCLVAAAMLRVALAERQQPAERKARRVKFSEWQKQKQQK